MEDIKSQIEQFALDDDADPKMLEAICPEALVEPFKRVLECSDLYWDSYWNLIDCTIQEALINESKKGEE